jgi:serine/threonine protein kinase
MTPERWQEVERIYHGALERPLGERAAFLDDSCRGDEALQSEVQSLLDESSSDTEFLEQPLLAAAHARQAAHQSRGLLGHRLSEYELTAWIGAGGMGEAYLAEHALLKRPCALKLLRPKASADPLALARFEREVQESARLAHHNTIEIYDYGHTDDGTFYYVMEYLRGKNLDELVAEDGPLPAA